MRKGHRTRFCPKGHDKDEVGRSPIGACRLCCNARTKAWQDANPEKRAAYKRSYRATPEGRATELAAAHRRTADGRGAQAAAKYQRTEKGRAQGKKDRAKYRARHWDKVSQQKYIWWHTTAMGATSHYRRNLKEAGRL